ncbi:MAG: hypothetical protein F4X68_00835 [Acidimicrobiia bacterium]|nr:hypothetical protein [Acidimicrobiia bacterium]MYB72501.1 hypothetical protein [Acidimicrobiia bacterium]
MAPVYVHHGDDLALAAVHRHVSQALGQEAVTDDREDDRVVVQLEHLGFKHLEDAAADARLLSVRHPLSVAFTSHQ